MGVALQTDLAPDRIAETYAAASQLPDAFEEYERQVRRVYQAVVAPGDVVVDIGAHNGKHTVPLAFAVGEHGRVLAAEPNPAILPVLRDRIATAAQVGMRVQLFEGCVQADAAVDELTFQVVEDRPGWSAMRARDEVTAVTEIRVAATTLDRLVPAELGPRVTFVKIDVEGAELAVLAGGEAVLGALPVHHVEISPAGAAAHGYSIDEYLGFYADDYLLVDMLGYTLADGAAMAASFSAAGVYDYVAIPRRHPRADELWVAVRRALTRGFASFEPVLPPVQPPAEPYGPAPRPRRRLTSSAPSGFPRSTAVAFPQPPPIPTAFIGDDGAVSALAGPPPSVAVSPSGALVSLGHGREFTVWLPGNGAVSLRLAAVVDVFSALWSHQTLLALRSGDALELVLRFFKPYGDPVIIVELLRLEGGRVRIASTGEVPFHAPHLDAEVRITKSSVVARIGFDSRRRWDLKAGFKLAEPVLAGKIGNRLPPADPEPFRGAALLASAVAGGGRRPRPAAPWKVRVARRGLRWLVVGSARRARQILKRVLGR